MQNEHVLGGLVHKRVEVTEEIEHLQSELARVMADLEAIDRSIRLFDPTKDLSTLPVRRYKPRQAVLQGLTRHVMGTFRTAQGPLTAQGIAASILTARGLGTADKALLQVATKRVRACLFKLRDRGVVSETAVIGGSKGWVRAE